jgi:hypothetical protein
MTTEDQRLRREAKALEVVKAMRPRREPQEFFSVPSEEAAALQALLDAPEHIYFIYSAGLVKIGYSTDWRTRVDTVCRGCAEPAELLLVMTGDRKMEQQYHVLFSESREGGEWFRLEGNVRRFLERYATPAGKEILELID